MIRNIYQSSKVVGLLSFLSTFWNLVQVVSSMCAMRTSVENKSAQGNLITTPVAYYYSDLFWTQGGSYWYKQETRHLSFLAGKNVWVMWGAVHKKKTFWLRRQELSLERFENVRWERLGTRRPHNWSDTNLRAGQRVGSGRGGRGRGGWNGKGVHRGGRGKCSSTFPEAFPQFWIAAN